MKLILVGVDASPRAPVVLQTAMELAQKTGGKLLVVRVVTLPVDIPLEAYSVTPSRLSDMLVKEGTEQLQQLTHGVPGDLIQGMRVEVGVPWQALCDVATETQAAMLVIGCHGYGLLDRVLGTTASKVVNHAPCSVLVVRPQPVVEKAT